MLLCIIRNSILIFFSVGLTGCAHSYYYLPEIEGEGAIHGRKGGIIYTIPPTEPAELTMRVRSLGIHKTHNLQMLGVRMSFVRPFRVQAAYIHFPHASPVGFTEVHKAAIYV